LAPALGNLIRICPIGQLARAPDPDNLQAAMKQIRRLAFVLLLLPKLPSAQTPALVQHVSASNTRNNGFSSPFCYFYQLPGLTAAGNSVVVGFTFKNKPTPTVTDDKGDSYTIAENFFDSTDGQSLGIAVAFNG